MNDDDAAVGRAGDRRARRGAGAATEVGVSRAARSPFGSRRQSSLPPSRRRSGAPAHVVASVDSLHRGQSDASGVTASHRPGSGSEQSQPVKPRLHTQQPLAASHAPRPPQSGQTGTVHAGPLHRPLHLQSPVIASHVPRGAAQSGAHFVRSQPSP